MENEGETSVAKGKYVVPSGVAVEELDGGKKKLSDECPPEVRSLLKDKDLVLVYDKMVAAIVEETNTRSVFGKWKDKEFVSIMELFRDEFAEKGVKCTLNKRKSGSGNFRWIEFIDTDIVPDYLSAYDVANRTGQIIKTIYSTLSFPDGVAVEELHQWKGRKALRESIPIYVEKVMEEHNLMIEYEMLVETCIKFGVGSKIKVWNTKKLLEVVDEYRPKFEAKGVTLFLGFKQEYVQTGMTGHNEKFRWIEFVDREKQPKYEPQRDAKDKDECVIS